MLGIEGKIALITGSGRGIGREAALMLAEFGADIIINDLKHSDVEENLADKIRSLGRKSIVLPCNVADNNEVEKMYEDAMYHFGRVDILVNNAGIARSNPMEKITLDDWNAVLDVNLTGVFNTCKIFTPQMKEHRWGRIINISSIAGRRGSQFGDVHYSSAKAGVIGFTKCLAQTIAKNGINVNAIAPGIAKTEILSEEHHQASLLKIPLGRAAEPREIASVILFYASSLSDYVTGTVLDVNGGSYM